MLSGDRPRSQLPLLLAVTVLVTVFWDYSFLTPLKILTVYFHEISHGLAAFATGGGIGHIVFEANQGGMEFPTGGNWFLIYNAGYLGSLLWGCGLILASTYSRRHKAVAGALGAFLGVITLLYARNFFGFWFGLAAAGGLLASAWKLSEETNDLIIKVIGVTSALYVIPDVYSDVITRSCMSDATLLASRTHVPRLVWGMGWIALSAATLWGTLGLAARAGKRRLIS